MRNKDKENLGRYLHSRRWKIDLPLIRPMTTDWATKPSDLEWHVVTIDFHDHVVRVPVAKLTFDEIRAIYEQVILYSEVC